LPSLIPFGASPPRKISLLFLILRVFSQSALYICALSQYVNDRWSNYEF